MRPAGYGFLKEFCAQHLDGFPLVLGHHTQGLMEIRVDLAAEVLAAQAHALASRAVLSAFAFNSPSVMT